MNGVGPELAIAERRGLVGMTISARKRAKRAGTLPPTLRHWRRLRRCRCAECSPTCIACEGPQFEGTICDRCGRTAPGFVACGGDGVLPARRAPDLIEVALTLAGSWPTPRTAADVGRREAEVRTSLPLMEARLRAAGIPWRRVALGGSIPRMWGEIPRTALKVARAVPGVKMVLPMEDE